MTDEEVFQLAIERTPPEQEQFLRSVCGADSDQLQRVERLVSAHQRGDSLLDTEAHVGTTESNGSTPPPKLIGDFVILGELGRGGMGVVYEARQKSLKRRVALKVLSSGLGLSSKAILRFRREAEAAGKLHHTNIVPIYTTGEDRGIHFYAMELIDGPSLDRVIEDLLQEEQPRGARIGLSDPAPAGSASRSQSSTFSGTAYFDQVATMIADVADALDHAHEQGVVHRDVKPSNLLLAPDGRLSINDFGLARMLEQPGMTVSGEFVGSPLYMSPEQIAAGRSPLDHRTDIYSLGATLYELLTLQPPFPGETRDAVLTQILHKEPPQPRKLNRRVPQDLETICLKAIERDPDRRYQTARQLAEDLRRFVNRHAIAARRIGPVGKTARWARRNPAVALLFVVVLCGLLGGFWMLDSQRRKDLKLAKQYALVHSLSGDFARAEQELERAIGLGASSGWQKMMQGLIEIFGHGSAEDIKLGRDLLIEASQELGKNSVEADCLRIIAHINAGDEFQYLNEVHLLQRVLDSGKIVPESATDFLYVGLAQCSALPRRAIENLNRSAELEDPGALLFMIRAWANMNVAYDYVDPELSLQYLDQAIDDATAAEAHLHNSPFAIAPLIQSLELAALLHKSRGDELSYQRYITEATEAAQRGARFQNNPHVTAARYRLMQTMGNQSDADALILGLDDDQTNTYLRIQRLLLQIRTGNSDVSEEKPNTLADHEVSLLKPLIVLLQMSSISTPDQLNAIREKFEAFMSSKSTRNVDNHLLASEWLVCRLLGLDDESNRCLARMRVEADWFRSTFLTPGCEPIVLIADQYGRDEILEKCPESRSWRGYYYFGCAVNALARGDRKLAEQHLKSCLDQGRRDVFVWELSHTLLARIADPSWLFWLPLDGDSVDPHRRAGSDPTTPTVAAAVSH